MRSYRKIIRIVIVQAMLLVFFFRYFLHYSFLRPRVDISFECIIAAVIAIAMLVDFWIVFPFVHERLPTYMFMVTCLLEASFICAVEYAMTHRFVTGVFNDSIRDFGARAVLLPIYSNIFFRDLALLLFVRLAADNIKLSETKAEDEKMLLRTNNQLIVRKQGLTHIVNMADIYYCQQAKNYTTLYSIDGQRHRKRISLKDLEVMLHDNQFVRISRSDIVRLSAIQKCKNNVLILKKEIVTDKKTLAITDSFQDTSIPEILKFLQGAHATGNNSPEQSARKGKTGSTAHNSTKATMIQRFIAAHRDCKLDEIVSGTRIPKSTVTRYLKELQSDGLIEYAGSKKTGGYRVVNHKNQQQEPSNVQ